MVQNKSRRRFVRYAAAASTIGLAGCFGNDEGEATETEVEETTAAEEEETTAEDRDRPEDRQAEFR